MIKFSLEELKITAKFRKVRDYKSKSKDELIKILSESKAKTNFSEQKIEEIREKKKMNQGIDFQNQVKNKRLEEIFMK